MKMLLKYVFLQIKLFVFSQIRAWKLEVRMPMNNKSQKNKEIPASHTSSLANAARILQ
jgi:hypothetical protein